MFQQNNYFPANAYSEYHLIVHNPNLFEGEDEDATIKLISEYDDVIPDKKCIKNQVDHDVRRYPLLLAIPHEKLSQHGPATKVATKEKISKIIWCLKELCNIFSIMKIFSLIVF